MSTTNKFQFTLEGQSVVSHAILEVIYRACQRGDSPERMHAAIMALLPDTAQAPSAPVAPKGTVTDYGTPQGVASVEREFVNAIANNFDSHDRENDEVICRGCSAPELWVEETRSNVITHRPECIVLRARAALSVKAEQITTEAVMKLIVRAEHSAFRKEPVYLIDRADVLKLLAAPTPPTTGQA